MMSNNHSYKLIVVMATLLLLSALFASTAFAFDGVRVKDISRVKGVRENVLVGYGIVSGLAGTGDSLRSKATLVSLVNTLKRFGVRVTDKDIRSRNVATVMIMAKLPAFVNEGDTLDVDVTSLGDARSLVGGTLMMADLKGPDQKIYALAQGPLNVGGYKFESKNAVSQKNHPTAAIIPNGAIVEREVATQLKNANGTVELALYQSDITTSMRVAEAINQRFQKTIAIAVSPSKVELLTHDISRASLMGFMRDVENVIVKPDSKTRVVVNERTGTVVSGGDVRIGISDITHGNIRISIADDTRVFQPVVIASEVKQDVVVIPDAQISVTENTATPLSIVDGGRVSDLIVALNNINASSREVISILQTLKAAGALHAELIIQ